MILVRLVKVTKARRGPASAMRGIVYSHADYSEARNAPVAAVLAISLPFLSTWVHYVAFPFGIHDAQFGKSCSSVVQ
jgi:hypothetical protein